MPAFLSWVNLHFSSFIKLQVLSFGKEKTGLKQFSFFFLFA